MTPKNKIGKIDINSTYCGDHFIIMSIQILNYYVAHPKLM